MIRAIVFDLDGTFIDSTPAIVASFEHTFQALGLEQPPRERLVNTIGHILEDQFSLFTDHDPKECVRVYREHYGTIAVPQTTLLPGESVAAFQAAGLKLAVATSKKLKFAEMILRNFDLCDCFHSRIGPDEVSQPKPHPECMHKSAEALGIGLDEMFLIGDTSFDVGAAHAAGVRCLAVTTGYDSREELQALNPELVADSLFEVTDYALANLG